MIQAKIPRQDIAVGDLLLQPYHAGVEPELFRLIQRNFEDLVPNFPQMLSATRTLDDTTAYVQAKVRLWNKREALGFLIMHQGLVAGHFNLKDIDWKKKQLELAYWLDASLRGQGRMSEVIRAMSLFCMEKLGMEYVRARVVTTNASSERVLLKNGFKYEGTFHGTYKTYDNREVDTHVYVLSRRDVLMMPRP